MDFETYFLDKLIIYMIQEIQRALKNIRRKNEHNKYIQSRNEQCAIRATTPLAVEQPQTLDLLSTATH